LSVTLALMLAAGRDVAQSPPAATRPTAAPQTPTVAVLTFKSNLKAPPEAGQMTADVLSARLCVVEGLRVVERQEIQQILGEQKLTLAGLVSPAEAVKAGKLLGAQLLLTGRVTSTGSGIYVICKAIHSETGQMKGFFLSLPQNISFLDLVDKTAVKLIGSLPNWARELIPPEKRGPAPAEVLKKLLAGKTAPPLAVVIAEQHIGPRVIDPAVETEFKALLTSAGVRPLELSEETIRKVSADGKDFARLSRVLAGTRYLIRGEAFSERAGTVHGLIIGVARAEVQVIDLQTGKVLLADRQTARAPDLGEHLAAKTALQKAGRKIAMRMLPKLFEHFPPAPKPKGEGKRGP